MKEQAWTPVFFFSSRRRHTRFALVSWARFNPTPLAYPLRLPPKPGKLGTLELGSTQRTLHPAWRGVAWRGVAWRRGAARVVVFAPSLGARVLLTQFTKRGLLERGPERHPRARARGRLRTPLSADLPESLSSLFSLLIAGTLKHKSKLWTGGRRDHVNGS